MPWRRRLRRRGAVAAGTVAGGANLIDADDAPYSPATLRAWKLAAESRAAESLKSPTADLLPEESTLIQLGSRIVVHATWDRASHNKWSFALIRPEIGDFDKLKEYVLTLSVLPENESYVVVESEGDARRINTACLGRSQSGQQVLELGVQDKLPPTDPNRYGSSFKLGEDGDLAVEQGGIAMVRGIEAAKQHIMCAMGVIKGEIRWDEEVGSLASEYFSKYRNNVGLLSRLMKLELIRLSLIPVASRFRRNEHRPSLHFVKRFVSVSIASTELAYSRLRVSVELEWGNGEYWAGDIPIFVLQNDA